MRYWDFVLNVKLEIKKVAYRSIDNTEENTPKMDSVHKEENVAEVIT
ncbi:hypothetical protein BACI71_60093 [Bacillus mycoides]|uniref:Uncharacterized protein n=1 Tax=Bacillus mycoides TaxID=1405 RepID=A0A654ATV2_BACMY|nr:hypothetical protein BACI71_60093 [Bacillus mycoides]